MMKPIFACYLNPYRSVATLIPLIEIQIRRYKESSADKDKMFNQRWRRWWWIKTAAEDVKEFLPSVENAVYQYFTLTASFSTFDLRVLCILFVVGKKRMYRRRSWNAIPFDFKRYAFRLHPLCLWNPYCIASKSLLFSNGILIALRPIPYCFCNKSLLFFIQSRIYPSSQGKKSEKAC